MKKGTKIGLGVAGSVLVIGGLVFLFRDQLFPKRAKRKACRKAKGKYNPKLDTCVKEGENIFSTDTNGGGNSSSSSSFVCPYRATPFKNKEEGNKFRAYMNEYYPKVAEAIKGGGYGTGLDLTGSYDNCYIREAYHKCQVKQGDRCNITYGEQYMTRGSIAGNSDNDDENSAFAM